MSNYTALLDANVLYPAPLRDLLLQLAITDLFRAKWTADIHREWIEALLRQEPHRDRTKLERTRALMDSHIRDCLVSGYESQIPTLELPDPDDRHVLAAAIVGRCDVIVTQNLRDFPDTALAPYGSTFSIRTTFSAITSTWRRVCFVGWSGKSAADSRTRLIRSSNIWIS
jgi:predicted nucleic acid-binding protein